MNGIAAYNVITGTEFQLLEVLPVGQDPLGTIKELTPWYNSFLCGHAGLNITTDSYCLYSREKDFYVGQEAYLEKFGGVGVSVLTPSRLITKDSFEASAKVDALVSGILQGMEIVRQQLGGSLGSTFEVLILATGASNTLDARNATSANPTRRNKFWHLIRVAVWLSGSPNSTRDQATAAARAAMGEYPKPLTVQAAYLNEGDPNEADRQNVFFGANYDELLAIK